jgi:hypothetical protein
MGEEEAKSSTYTRSIFRDYSLLLDIGRKRVGLKLFKRILIFAPYSQVELAKSRGRS